MLRSKKPMNKVSSKYKKKLMEYSKVRKEYMMLHIFCEVCGVPATDIHHKERRGLNMCNADTFMSVCRPCHIKIESNGKWAREMGYLV